MNRALAVRPCAAGEDGVGRRVEKGTSDEILSGEVVSSTEICAVRKVRVREGSLSGMVVVRGEQKKMYFLQKKDVVHAAPALSSSSGMEVSTFEGVVREIRGQTILNDRDGMLLLKVCASCLNVKGMHASSIRLLSLADQSSPNMHLAACGDSSDCSWIRSRPQVSRLTHPSPQF